MQRDGRDKNAQSHQSLCCSHSHRMHIHVGKSSGQIFRFDVCACMLKKTLRTWNKHWMLVNWLKCSFILSLYKDHMKAIKSCLYFRETSHMRMRSFVKIKFSKNRPITLSSTDIGKSFPSHDFLPSQICLFTQFTKIIFSLKFLNSQYGTFC